MAKGRAKGTKVESYTFSKGVQWKAGPDGLAALATAQGVLRGNNKIKLTRNRVVQLLVQNYLDNLSPQQMVKIIKAEVAEEVKAADDAKRAKAIEVAAKKAKEANEALAKLQNAAAAVALVKDC